MTFAAVIASALLSISLPDFSAAGLIEQRQSDSNYTALALYHHNIHRTNHSAPSVIWNDTVAAHAETIATACDWTDADSNTGGYGQNLEAGSTSVAAAITDAWYNSEEPNYPLPYGVEPDMSNFDSWGHFSQVVWVGSAQIGCYTANCSATGITGLGGDIAPYFTVCNYYPPGNYIGEFAENVLPPLGEPTVTV